MKMVYIQISLLFGIFTFSPLTYTLKVQIENVLGFAGHMVFVGTIKLF
jgi:hypothetical protein